MKKIVCVDLDGVLADYRGWRGHEHIGEPRPGAVEFTRSLAGFAHVVVYTTRCNPALPDRPPGSTPASLATPVRAWLDSHGFHYDEVHIGPGKPIAAAYIDDRAVPIPTNPDWSAFRIALAQAQMLCDVPVAGE